MNSAATVRKSGKSRGGKRGGMCAEHLGGSLSGGVHLVSLFQPRHREASIRCLRGILVSRHSSSSPWSRGGGGTVLGQEQISTRDPFSERFKVGRVQVPRNVQLRAYISNILEYTLLLLCLACFLFPFFLSPVNPSPTYPGRGASPIECPWCFRFEQDAV